MISESEQVARARREVAELVRHHQAGEAAAAKSIGSALIERLRDAQDPVFAPMLADALALTAFALLAEDRYSEADALWSESIRRFEDRGEPIFAESMVFAWHGRVVAALRQTRVEEAARFVRDMIELLRTRRRWGPAPLLHVAETGYALTGAGENALALELLALLSELGEWADPQARSEMIKGIAYRIVAASHLGDEAVVEKATQDLEQCRFDAVPALREVITRALTGSKYRRLDAGLLLLIEKDLLDGLERPEDAKRVTDQFIEEFLDSEIEQFRTIALELREDA